MGPEPRRLAWVCVAALAPLGCTSEDEAPPLSQVVDESTGGSVSSGGGSGRIDQPSTGGAPAASGGASLRSGGANQGGTGASAGLSWPIDCLPESTCFGIGYPDINEDGQAHDCGDPGYFGHQGTDISITWEQMEAGVDVLAAAEGTVFFVADGKFDRCPDESQPDCEKPDGYAAGSSEGTTVCTELGPYCNPPGGSCFWCFAGGNVVVILHDSSSGVFATRYDHFKTDSIAVSVGDAVSRGQKIGEVGSAGNSTGPHLHFEVWGEGYYDLVDPWAGDCGPNTSASLWAADPPWDG